MNAVVAPARAGWCGELALGFERSGERTVLRTRSHSGPLLVQRAFHPEGDPCHLYLIHPPGGVVGGDELRVTATVAAGAHALLTTPAAGKFYRSNGQQARFTQEFSVHDGTLEWLPQENIFYPDTDAYVATRIRLAGAARTIAWEIGCLGLPASQGIFASGSVRQELQLWHDEKPLLIDHLHLEAAALQARWGMSGHVVLGTLLAFPANAEQLELARTHVADEPFGAATLVDGVLVVRVLAQRADLLRARFVRLWQDLRPLLLGRAASVPRIWAT